ncbi:MAG: hypothetical protein HOK67_25010 [Deltaproteobacteria bacterium]|nr:hypothetical protein [Deltaproteobacteria bacterium]
MTTEDVSYDILKSKYDDLQKQVTRFLSVERSHARTRDLLDQEMARFKIIQAYSENAIHTKNMEELGSLTVESIAEAFEFECSALLKYEQPTHNVKVLNSFGFEEPPGKASLDMHWIDEKGPLKKGKPFIEEFSGNKNSWDSMGLCQAIVCPYFDENEILQGFLLGGRSVNNKDYYDEIREEVLPSFSVFTQQMGALLGNVRSQVIIKQQLEKLQRSNSELQETMHQLQATQKELEEINTNLEGIVEQRTKELKGTNEKLTTTNRDLHKEIIVRKEVEEKLRLAEKSATELSEFLKKMFGRYISTEVMNSLIENPSTTELGGEKRNVTIMISDLRGFTSLSERLEPEQVVTLLNNYFEMMVDIIFQYNGTINEIIGDGLVVIFGAPKSTPDQTQNAIACAIEMQNAMQEVNRQNRALELPELEMGIGLNETEVIVGNIGSSKRTKYGAIGSGMNQAARIESYTVGGQILVSESILKENGQVLRVDQQFEVFPKGSDLPLKIYDIGGIAGNYNLSLESEHLNLQILAKKIPVKYTILEGKHVGRMDHDGHFVKLSSKSAEMVSDRPLETLINLKISLENAYEGLARTAFYAKVVKSSESKERHRLIQFTSVPPEIISYFQAHLQYALEPCPDVVKKQKT